MSFSGFVRPYASSSRLSLTHGARNVTPANDRHDSTSSESHPRSFRKKKKKDIVFLATIKTRLNFIKLYQFDEVREKFNFRFSSRYFDHFFIWRFNYLLCKYRSNFHSANFIINNIDNVIDVIIQGKYIRQQTMLINLNQLR